MDALIWMLIGAGALLGALVLWKGSGAVLAKLQARAQAEAAKVEGDLRSKFEAVAAPIRSEIDTLKAKVALIEGHPALSNPPLPKV